MLKGIYLAKSIARKWPYRGQLRLGKLLGLRSSTLPEGAICITPDDRCFRIHKDPIYLNLFLQEEYHPNETKMMRSLVKPGDIVVDVGANFGAYTTLFALVTGSTGHVHAFEPSPKIFTELEDNIILNSLKELVVLNACALGAEPKKGLLYSFPGFAHGLSSLSNLGRKNFETSEISIITLDDYCTDQQIKHVDLVKIDVEGSEMDVLRGASKLLDGSNPPMIVIEINEQTASYFGYKPLDLLYYLSNKFNYNTFCAFRRGVFVRLPSYDDIRHGEMILVASASAHKQRLEQILRSSIQLFPNNLHIETDYHRVKRNICPVCSGQNLSFVYRLFDDRYGMPDDFDIIRCEACGAHFLREYLPEAFLAKLYTEYYGNTSSCIHKSKVNLQSKIRQKIRKTQLWSFVMGGVDLASYICSGDKVLDVGCGYGTNAEAVRQRGASWFGIDVDKKVCEALETAEMPCFHGTLNEFTKDNTDKFDRVILSQVIEHSSAPITLLSQARDCLNQNGRILLSCPNVESRYRQRFGSQWLHWHVPYHIVQFSAESLQTAAKRSGLQIEWYRTATPPSWYLAQRRHKQTLRGVRNLSYRIPFEPFKWLLLSPFLRLGDVFVREGGDALIACLKKA